MIIYGEYLFIENMITGLLILHFTSKALGETPAFWRIFFSGICCGLYAFILFTDLSGLSSIVGKTLFSIAMVLLCFGRDAPGIVLRKAAVFLGVTILYGGIAIAILTSFGLTGITAVSGVYLPTMTYTAVTAVAACSAWLLWILMEILRARRLESLVIVDAEIQLGNHRRLLKGLIDSGNTLRDPLTGKPVGIVRKTLMDELLTDEVQSETRYTVIPYHGVGVENGILEGYRIDKLTVGRQSLVSPVLAICEETLFFEHHRDLQILLPGMMLERGIHGKDTTV